MFCIPAEQMVGVEKMLLVFSFMRQSIISRKSDIQFKMLQLRKKQTDLQAYASSIGDGSISMNDLMNSPASMFGRMTYFMQSSHQQSLMGAQANIGGMLAMAQVNGVFANLQPQMQQQYQQMIFKNLYDKERERFNQQEQKILNQQDKKIEQEIAQLNTQLQLLDAQEKAISEGESKAVQNESVKFA